MQTDEFLKKVRLRAGLEDNERARQAIDAVFGALRARISHAGGDNAAEQLPKEIRELWESGLAEHVTRSFTGVDRMALNEFLGRVQSRARLANADHAEAVVRAVFMTMKEQLTRGAQQSIEHQLPDDIRVLWQTSNAPAEAKEAQPSRVEPAAGLFRSDDQLTEDIIKALEIDDEIEDDRINVHVQQGSVTLRGIVRTSREWEAANRAASQTLGVREVRNELTILESM
ncbi:MAG: DUF2267 domain-containing protein [Armatimonadota bacterium]